MNVDKPLYLDDIDAFVLDFDGVLTTNKVYVNQEGEEFVCCSRSDGLAFDVIRKLNKSVYILSTEKNKVVSARAAKLKVKVIQGVDSKVDALNRIAENEGYSLGNIFYVGNDLNDFHAIELCGYSACPKDSHERICNMSNYVLNSVGGDGVAREILEDLFQLDLVEILYGD